MGNKETDVLQYILNVSRPTNKLPVRTAGLTAIMEVVTSSTGTSNITYLLEHGLMEVLSQCLDQSRVSLAQSYNSLTIMVAMKLTWHLSRVSHLVVRPLMTEGFFMKLLRFVDIGGDFFEFSRDFGRVFSSLVLRKQLIADVRIEKLSGGQSRDLLEILPTSADLPRQIHKCRCFDTTGVKDVDISEDLIRLNVAWPSDKDLSQCDNWKDVIVTKILDKQYFYALIGEGAIRQEAVIKSVMEESISDLQPAKIEIEKIVVVGVVVVGVVMVDVSSSGHREFLRGQILSHQGQWVKVALLDYGGVEDVVIHQVYELPSALSLMYFPAQASLCCLTGVCPAPHDTYVSQLALASLCNLVRHSVASGLVLMKTDCVTILRTVLLCPDPVLVLQAVRVLNNLSSNPRIEKFTFQQILLDVLALMKSLEMKVWSVKLKEDICYAILSCIANILCMGKQFRSLFYMNEGLSIVLHKMKNHHPSRPISKMARQLLRNFLVEIQVKSKMTGSTPADLVGDSRALNVGLHRLREKDVSRQERSISPGPLTSVTDSPRSQSLLLEDVSSSGDEEEKQEENEIRHRILHDSDESSIAPGDIGSGSVVAVNSGEVIADPEDFYVYDSYVDFCDDSTHELRPHRCLKDVSRIAIAEITCGMLNSNGGTIYFGITKDRHVKGVEISRDGRDSFRLGVDQMMMNRLSPAALYIQFELVYRPVFCGTQPGKYTQVTDLFVVEIRIRPSRAALHSMTSTKQCYYRFGHNNLPLSTKEVRELVVAAEEDNYKEEILGLRHKLQTWKQKLAAH